MRKIFISILIVLNLFTQVYAEAPLISHTDERNYTIQLDNELTIVYYYKDGRAKDIYNKIPVLPNGKATIPKLGEIQVTGLTHKELTEKISNQLDDQTELEIIIYRVSNNVTVIGAVNKPGSYPIKDIKTIYDALGKAGGFSNVANKSKVKLIRQRIDGTRSETYINFPKEVFHAYEEGVGEEKYLLKEGDLIYVYSSKLKHSGYFLLRLLQVATIGVISGVVSVIIN